MTTDAFQERHEHLKRAVVLVKRILRKYCYPPAARTSRSRVRLPWRRCESRSAATQRDSCWRLSTQLTVLPWQHPS